MSDLSLFLEKSSKDLQRTEAEGILVTVALSSLSESEEAEAFAWNAGNLEIPQLKLVVQVFVSSSRINLRPRVCGPVV